MSRPPQKRFFNFPIEWETVAITVFLWAYLLYFWFGKNSFLLDTPTDLIISEATREGKDVGERVSFFYRVLGIGAILFPLLYFLAQKLKSIFNIRAKDLQAAAVVSSTGFFLVLADLIGVESSRPIGLFLVLLALCSLAVVLAKSTFKIFRPINQPAFLGNTLSISFIVLSALMMLFNSSPWVVKSISLAYFSITIIVSAILIFTRKLGNFSYRRIFSLASPIALASLFIFISVEAVFYFKLKQDFFISYKWLLIGLLLGAFIISTLFKWKKKPRRSSTKILSRFLAPSALLAFLLLTLYLPYREHNPDIFEFANPANALMNIFHFHQIPFVDFMSSHMFADQYFGIVYNFIFGYENTQDFITYIFSYFIIFSAIAYFFLLRLFRSAGLAVLFLIAFPFVNEFFSANIFYAVIVFFLIIRLVRKQTFWNYAWLILSLILLIIWRLDTGSAALFTAAVFLPISFFTAQQKVAWKPLLRALGLAMGVTALVTLIVVIIRSGDYLLDNFRSALHYAAANQAHGYPSVAHEHSQQFYFYHFFIPLIALGCTFTIIYLLRTREFDKGDNRPFILNVSMFLFIICVMNFQRGLVRHSFFEGSEHFVAGTFFIATALFLLYLIKAPNGGARYASLFGISFMLMVSLKYFPISQHKTPLAKFMTEMTLANIDDYFHEEAFKGRIIPNQEYANNNYAELKQFLDKNLEANQTFLDFSNSPMLYYYCERRIPGYFCQSLQNSVDDYLQIQHLEWVAPTDVPVVVYSNYPPNWFDATDGVPNAMRQYLMAEYIYQNYQPFALMSSRSIWIAKGKSYDWNINQTDEKILQSQTFEYRKAAYFINRFYEKKNFKDLELVATESPEQDTGTGRLKINLPATVKQLGSVYARLIFDKTEASNLQLHINGSESTTGSFTFETTTEDKAYMLRLSNHYLWHIKQNSYLKLDGKNYPLVKVEFYKDTRL